MIARPSSTRTVAAKRLARRAMARSSAICFVSSGDIPSTQTHVLDTMPVDGSSCGLSLPGTPAHGQAAIAVSFPPPHHGLLLVSARVAEAEYELALRLPRLADHALPAREPLGQTARC